MVFSLFEKASAKPQPHTRGQSDYHVSFSDHLVALKIGSWRAKPPQPMQEDHPEVIGATVIGDEDITKLVECLS